MSSEAGRIIDLYQRRALEWVRDRERPPDGEILARPVSRADFTHSVDPRYRMRVCGTDFALSDREPGTGVTGVVLRRRPSSISAGIVYPTQEWACGRYAHAGRLRAPFDGIMAWDSFFHLRADDQRRMFPVFRQHAAPAAALMFTSGPAHGEAIGRFEGEPLVSRAASIRPNIDLCWINTDFGWSRRSSKTRTADATPLGSRNAFSMRHEPGSLPA